jgi:hypothetical protein
MRASSAFQTAPITEKPLKTLKEIKLQEITKLVAVTLASFLAPHQIPQEHHV